MRTKRNQDLLEIQELFATISKQMALEWNQNDQTNLSLSHVLILEMLQKEGSKRPSDIALQMQVTTGGITSLTHKLVDNHYVKKVQDDHDRRVAKLEITDYGETVLAKAIVQRAAMVENLFGGLQDEDINELKRIGKQLKNRKEN